ncbi:hypothetical protein ASF03_16785 [Rhizobium sp. Leaf68]|nr:hypothetical protein ASE62_15045 [Rhizobium sp. Leaf202]KQN82524.1 hypothetical protein ASF03_16785 [Rhizobium sp. Leaf68]
MTSGREGKNLSVVILGLDPRIHHPTRKRLKTWILGSGPRMTGRGDCTSSQRPEEAGVSRFVMEEVADELIWSRVPCLKA